MLTNYSSLRKWLFVVIRAAIFLGLSSGQLHAQTSIATGTFAVNKAGAATYRIPLRVAPGKGGLSPELTLQYNSQSPNGVFGVGWTLSGVSSVTRCPKTPAEDGDRVGAKNDATDLFCLDGQKMRSVSGTYGASGTQYRTAIDIYGRITSLGNVAGGPQSFTLETKSGEIYTFGGTLDSRLEHPTKGVIRTWMVSEIKDRYNNRITYSYSKNSTLGEQLLNQVDYSNGRLQFEYETRPDNDPIIHYDDGIQFGSTNSRVKAVSVSHLPLIAGTPTLTPLQTYQLKYSQSSATGRSMLKSVQQCVASSNCLPAQTFTYADSLPATLFARGLNDLPLSNDKYYAIKQRDGKDQVRRLTSIYEFLGLNLDPFSGQKATAPVVWDIDGDGITDFEIVSYGEYDGNERGHQRRTWLSSTGKLTIVDALPRLFRCYADLNGDGQSEAYTIKENYSDAGLSSLTITDSLSGFSLDVPTTGDQYLAHICRPSDVNGDGRADLFAGRRALIFSKNGIQLGPEILSHSPALYMSSFPGDFNGDGKTDYLYYFRGIFESLGIYSLDTSLGSLNVPFVNSPVLPSTSSRPVCVADFNGDGRSDVLLHDRFLLSNGRAMTSYPLGLPSPGLDESKTSCGDFNGDGLADFYFWGVHYLNMLPAHVDRLTEVNNGVGFVHQVQYKPITDSSVYTRGAGAVYPQIDMQTPTIVVSTVRSGSTVQGWNSIGYRYAALRSDLKRNGTQGFEKVTSTDQGTGISNTSQFYQSFPLTGLISRLDKFVGNEAAPQTLESTTYGYLVRGSGTIPASQGAQVHQNQRTTTVFDLRQPGRLVGTERNVIESFDAYGFPLREKTERLDGSGGLTSINTATHEYNHQSAPWLLGQLVKSSTTAQNLRSLPGTVTPATPLTLQVNLTEVLANVSAPGPWSTVLSATAAGGVAPYSYSWTRTVGSRTTISNANSANATVAATLISGEVFNETVRVTLTDAIGGSAYRDVIVRYVSPFIFNPTITVNTSNYNLRAAAVAAGWDQTTPMLGTVTVNAGVMLSANSVSSYGFDTGAGFPIGTTLTLVNNGAIIGMGGAGGAGSRSHETPAAGQRGGPAMRAQAPINVRNNGTIAGGGNGGSGGTGWDIETSGGCCFVITGPSGGGGRSGATNSAGGNPGTSTAPGAGVISRDDWGIVKSVSQAGGPYGGGPAVIGNANIVWQSAGTRLGELN